MNWCDMCMGPSFLLEEPYCRGERKKSIKKRIEKGHSKMKSGAHHDIWYFEKIFYFRVKLQQHMLHWGCV